MSAFQPICLPLCAPPFYSIQALVVRFEADTERRKVGLPHRVTFLGRSLLEPEYTQTEEVQLNRQRHAVCTNAVFQLHVSNLTSWMCFFLLLWKADFYPSLKRTLSWIDIALINYFILFCCNFGQKFNFTFPLCAGEHPWQTASHLFGHNPHHQARAATQTLCKKAGEAAADTQCLPFQYAPLWGLQQNRKRSIFKDDFIFMSSCCS